MEQFIFPGTCPDSDTVCCTHLLPACLPSQLLPNDGHRRRQSAGTLMVLEKGSIVFDGINELLLLVRELNAGAANHDLTQKGTTAELFEWLLQWWALAAACVVGACTVMQPVQLIFHCRFLGRSVYESITDPTQARSINDAL